MIAVPLPRKKITSKMCNCRNYELAVPRRQSTNSFFCLLERWLWIVGSRIFARVWERSRPGQRNRQTRGLHHPNHMIFLSGWRHRETYARNRESILSNTRTLSAMCLMSLLRVVLQRIPRLFTMHPRQSWLRRSIDLQSWSIVLS